MVQIRPAVHIYVLTIDWNNNNNIKVKDPIDNGQIESTSTFLWVTLILAFGPE